MASILEQFKQEQVAALTQGKTVPDFRAGDTLSVSVKVIELKKDRTGKMTQRVRTQKFEGVCIKRRNRGFESSFTVRKISFGEGVERTFPLYSPKIEITVVRCGVVRRAKLYYLRDRRGKQARIRERKEIRIADGSVGQNREGAAARATDGSLA